MAPKVEIHLIPKSTQPPSYHSFSLWKVFKGVVIALLAVVGFLSFSPFSVLEKITDINLFNAFNKNKDLQRSLQTMDAEIQTLSNKITEDDSLRNKVALTAGIPLQRTANIEEETSEVVEFDYAHLGIGPAKYLKKIRKAHRDFSKLRDTLVANPNYAASLPIIHPLKKHHNVTARYEAIMDPRIDQLVPHRGLDFATSIGDTIIAPGAGLVASVTNDRSYGISITLLHNSKMETFFAHLDRSLVSPGQRIQRGQPIALSGNSGLSSGPHLHYEKRYLGQTVNPEHYFIAP